MTATQMKLLCASVLAIGIVSTANAATLSESSSAPTTNILTSQLTDLGPGPQTNNRDYTDNGGPVSQTFMVPTNSTAGAITILGRGDAGGGFNAGNFHIQIGSVNLTTGQITQLDNESVASVAAAHTNDYLTFTLANPVPLTAGTTYSFSIYNEPSGWYGLAHSTADAYPNGTAFNNDLTITSAGNADPSRTFNGFVSPNPGNYDYVFAVQAVVPEPATLGLLSLAALSLLSRRRRDIEVVLGPAAE